MTLARYFASALLRYALIIFLLFVMLIWLGELAELFPRETALNGSSLNIWLKLSISLAWALPQALNLMVFIFMIAAVIVLTILGHRAELHVLRGAGLSPQSILLILAAVTATMMVAIELGPRPLAHEVKQLADARFDPLGLTQQNRAQHQQVAWTSAKDGDLVLRLTGYDPTAQTADEGRLQSANADLIQGFTYLSQVSLDQGLLVAMARNLDGSESEITLTLDASPQILPAKNTADEAPLLHLLGWLETPEVETYGSRNRSYLIQSALAQPLLAAALVMVAGTFCVGIGTRQSIGQLFFVTLGLVVLTYSIFAVTEAFGLVGKLPPVLAAWGTFLLISCLAGFILSLQALAWLAPTPHMRARPD